MSTRLVFGHPRPRAAPGHPWTVLLPPWSLWACLAHMAQFSDLDLQAVKLPRLSKSSESKINVDDSAFCQWANSIFFLNTREKIGVFPVVKRYEFPLHGRIESFIFKGYEHRVMQYSKV